MSNKFLKGVELNEGNDYGYFIPNLLGNGAPSETTEGDVGSQYMDTSNEKIYICTAREEGNHTWIEVAKMPTFNLSEYLSKHGYPSTLIMGEDNSVDYDVGAFDEIRYAAMNGPIRIIINVQYDETIFPVEYIVLDGSTQGEHNFSGTWSICGLGALAHNAYILFYLQTHGTICHFGISQLVTTELLQEQLASTVKSVNNAKPDEDGKVELEVGEKFEYISAKYYFEPSTESMEVQVGLSAKEFIDKLKNGQLLKVHFHNEETGYYSISTSYGFTMDSQPIISFAGFDIINDGSGFTGWTLVPRYSLNAE